MPVAWSASALRFEPGQISGIWLPHGILVAALLAAPVRRWWLYTAALLPTHLHLVGTFQAPIPLVVMLIQFAGNIASACLAAALLRRVLGQPPRLDTLSRMGAFIASGGDSGAVRDLGGGGAVVPRCGLGGGLLDRVAAAHAHGDVRRGHHRRPDSASGRGWGLRRFGAYLSGRPPSSRR